MATPAQDHSRLRAKRASQHTTPLGERTKLLHVNLPEHLVMAVRAMAAEERRTITAQVALVLEDSEQLQQFINDTPELKRAQASQSSLGSGKLPRAPHTVQG